jgi:hypothetical protein
MVLKANRKYEDKAKNMNELKEWKTMVRSDKEWQCRIVNDDKDSIPRIVMSLR